MSPTITNPGSIHCETCDRILGAIPSSVLVLDRSLRILAVNQNFLMKARRRSEETLGRRLAEVFPEAILSRTSIEERVLEVLASGSPGPSGRFTFNAPGIVQRTYFYRVVPFSGDGRDPEAAVLILDDVTEQCRLGNEVRKAERRLARIVECASDVVASLDAEGRVTSWNRAAEVLTGLGTTEAVGSPIEGLLREQDRPHFRATLDEALAGRRPPCIELGLRGARGNAVPVLWSFSPLAEDEDEKAKVVAVGRNLTDVRRLEERLLETEKLISLGIMASGIAHELRNPLAIVSAAAELLLDRPRSAELGRQCLEKIVGGVERAARIIEALLRFARPAEREEFHEIDLRAIVDEVVVAFRTGPSQRVLPVVRSAVPQKGPLEVHGNPELLKIALSNVVSNAVEVTPEGGIVTVSVEVLPQGEAALKVADTGPGIAKADLKRIFDPFFTTKRPGEGIGLGLSIAFSIVRAHGGRIEVESEPGRGSTFILIFPLARSVRESAPGRGGRGLRP